MQTHKTETFAFYSVFLLYCGPLWILYFIYTEEFLSLFVTHLTHFSDIVASQTFPLVWVYFFSQGQYMCVTFWFE